VTDFTSDRHAQQGADGLGKRGWAAQLMEAINDAN
jgi:hypothetical protein